MITNSDEVKFTDVMEREMIQREVDDISDSIGNIAEPLLKWVLAIALSVGTLLVVISSAQ